MEEHSVIFGDGSIYPYGDHTKKGFARGINTWNDWHLIPTSRPEIAPPEVYTNYVDLPAVHGKLDLSEYLTGKPIYKNRSGTLDFYAANGYGFWAERASQIYNFIHGKKMYLTLWDEPEYFYTGRLKVKPWHSDGKSNFSTVSIDYELDPFKFLLPRETFDEYWDRFLFEDAHAYEYLKDIPASASQTFTIPGYDNGFMMDAFISDNSTFPASATIVLNESEMTISRVSANTFTVKSGTLDPVVNSTNMIQVTGSGLVNLVFWGGCL